MMTRWTQRHVCGVLAPGEWLSHAAPVRQRREEGRAPRRAQSRDPAGVHQGSQGARWTLDHPSFHRRTHNLVVQSTFVCACVCLVACVASSRMFQEGNHPYLSVFCNAGDLPISRGNLSCRLTVLPLFVFCKTFLRFIPGSSVVVSHHFTNSAEALYGFDLWFLLRKRYFFTFIIQLY